MKRNRLLSILSALLVITSAISCSDNNISVNDSSSEAVTEESTEETTAEITTEKATEEPTTEKTTNKSDSADINDYFTSDTPQPALWKATDPDSGNELYLLGTIHVAGDSTFPLPDYIMDVYEDCSGIAVEYDVNALQNDFAQMQEYLIAMAYTDGSTISDHVSKESYEAAKEYFESEGVYNAMLDYYLPGFWISQIQSQMLLKVDNLSTEGVDSTFLTYAAEDGKEIVSIETLEIQAGAVTGFSDELADYMLAELAKEAYDLEQFAEDLAETYNYWAAGEVDKLEDFSDDLDELPKELHDDYEDYMNIMLYERNKGMADKAEEFLKNGDNYFFMVGAMHFAGNKGVDDLLKEKGYTVERVK